MPTSFKNLLGIQQEHLISYNWVFSGIKVFHFRFTVVCIREDLSIRIRNPPTILGAGKFGSVILGHMTCKDEDELAGYVAVKILNGRVRFSQQATTLQLSFRTNNLACQWDTLLPILLAWIRRSMHTGNQAMKEEVFLKTHTTV